MNKRSRLTLDMDADLHLKVKVTAAQRRTSMRDFCLAAIQEHLARIEKAQHLTAWEAPLLAELWDNEEDAVYDDI